MQLGKRVLVIDNVRSCHNVGSLLRTADCFGFDSVVYVGCAPYPGLANDTRLPHIQQKLTNKISKTALGAENLAGIYCESPESALEELKGCRIISLEQSTKSIKIDDLKPAANDERVAVIVGNEVRGVDLKFLGKSSSIVEISMLGSKESLNVCVAFGILGHQLSKHNHQKTTWRKQQ